MPFGNLGMWEILLIMLVILLVFGAKRLPELGGSLGKGIREFKRSMREIENELTKPVVDEPERQLKAPTQSVPAVPPSTSTSASVSPAAEQAATEQPS